MNPAIALATVFYVVLCLLVGLCGHYRRIGFLPAAILAALLTPPLMLVLLWLTGPRTSSGRAPRRG